MKPLSISAALFIVLIALTGCSSSGDEGDRGESAVAPADADEGAGDDLAQFDVAEQRELVYTAALDVVAEDPDAVAEQVWAVAESYGGTVTADRRAGSSAVLTVRIPSEDFTDAMDELAGLADEESGRMVDTEDVTGQAVDLESAIATKSASLERVRALLGEAVSVDEVLALETELSDREAELASLESQLAELQESVALSTITYTVTSPVEEDRREGYTGPSGFVEGVGTGWSGLVGLLRVAAVVVGVLLPFAPLAALVLAGVFVPVRYVRRRRARAAR